ncbi:hypothetical protein [Actinosynnema sp. NPDC020468]|uniref:hypothetical protein n=1 Tax=Actinosynnema sp. NPDC020468 TaxID=3154488 RepID=UPI0033D651B0
MDHREERVDGGQPAAGSTHRGEADPARTTDDVIRRVEAEPEFRDRRAKWAAEALQRREGDVALRDELAAQGFEGTLWWLFTHELARYGYAVVVAWLRTDEMFAQCKKRGCYPGPPPLDWEWDDVHSLANDTVGQAILDFRERALIGGGWRSDGGASLKTYFVGRCVFAFPNFYRKWRTEQWHRRRLGSAAAGVEDIAGLSSSEQDPADLAVARLHLWRSFADIPDERTKRALLLQESGYRVEEIAELLGEASKDVVRGLLQRQRKRGRDARGAADA